MDRERESNFELTKSNGELSAEVELVSHDLRKAREEIERLKRTVAVLENNETVKALAAACEDIKAGRIKPWSEIEPGLYELEIRQLRQERDAALQREAKLREALVDVIGRLPPDSRGRTDWGANGDPDEGEYSEFDWIAQARAALAESEAAQGKGGVE